MSNSRARLSLDTFAIGVSLAYPFFVYIGLRYLPTTALLYGLIGFLILRLILSAVARHSLSKLADVGVMVVAGGGALIVSMISPVAGLKSYPIFLCLSLAAFFAYSLLSPPTIIERIARLREPDLPISAIHYLRQVTIAWVIFFLLNSAISLATALGGNMELWTLYNGFISYVLVGGMFVGEYLIRRFVRLRDREIM